LSTEIH